VLEPRALARPRPGPAQPDVGTGAFNTAQGTQLDLWTCNGGANQQWSVP
jgi:hypothetical protein